MSDFSVSSKPIKSLVYSESDSDLVYASSGSSSETLVKHRRYSTSHSTSGSEASTPFFTVETSPEGRGNFHSPQARSMSNPDFFDESASPEEKPSLHRRGSKFNFLATHMPHRSPDSARKKRPGRKNSAPDEICLEKRSPEKGKLEKTTATHFQTMFSPNSGRHRIKATQSEEEEAANQKSPQLEKKQSRKDRMRSKVSREKHDLNKENYVQLGSEESLNSLIVKSLQMSFSPIERRRFQKVTHLIVENVPTLSPEQLLRISKLYPNLRHVTLKGCQGLNYNIDEVVQRLTSLDLTSSRLHSSDISHLTGNTMTQVDKLRSFKWKYCSSTSFISLYFFLRQQKNLKALDLSYFNHDSFWSEVKDIERGVLKSSFYPFLRDICPRLEALNLSYNPNLTDVHFLDIIDGFEHNKMERKQREGLSQLHFQAVIDCFCVKGKKEGYTLNDNFLPFLKLPKKIVKLENKVNEEVVEQLILSSYQKENSQMRLMEEVYAEWECDIEIDSMDTNHGLHVLNENLLAHEGLLKAMFSAMESRPDDVLAVVTPLILRDIAKLMLQYTEEKEMPSLRDLEMVAQKLITVVGDALMEFFDEKAMSDKAISYKELMITLSRYLSFLGLFPKGDVQEHAREEGSVLTEFIANLIERLIEIADLKAVEFAAMHYGLSKKQKEFDFWKATLVKMLRDEFATISNDILFSDQIKKIVHQKIETLELKRVKGFHREDVKMQFKILATEAYDELFFERYFARPTLNPKQYFQNLKSLNLSFTAISVKTIEALSEVDSLEKLNIRGCKEIFEHRRSYPPLIEALRKFKNLKWLKIGDGDYQEVTPEYLDVLEARLRKEYKEKISV